VVQHFGTSSSPQTQSQANPAPPVVQGSTNTPSSPPSLQAEPQPVNEQPIAQENISPNGTGVAGIPTTLSQQSWEALTYQLLNPLPINGWGVQQTVVVALVLGLMLLFILDFAVLHR